MGVHISDAIAQTRPVQPCDQTGRAQIWLGGNVLACNRPEQNAPAPVLCVTGPATGVPAGVATYGGAPAAALPDDVVKPPDDGDAAPAELVVGVVVVVGTGASAGPEDGAPSALGIGGNPHLTLSCSMFCSQYVLPALPRHAAR